MKRGLDYRRHVNEKIIKKRKQIWEKISPNWTNKNLGKFRKNNFSCGCHMCKPQKFNKSQKFKYSERKQLLDD